MEERDVAEEVEAEPLGLDYALSKCSIVEKFILKISSSKMPKFLVGMYVDFLLSRVGFWILWQQEAPFSRFFDRNRYSLIQFENSVKLGGLELFGGIILSIFMLSVKLKEICFSGRSLNSGLKGLSLYTPII